MRHLTRLALAGALVGGALLPAAPSHANTCIPQPCYVCVMYPCYPTDWPPFLIDRARDICSTAVSYC